MTKATQEALKLEDDDEASIRLVRLALILGDLEGDKVVDLLVDILGGEGCSADCNSTEICGNGILDGGESCDDGNVAGGDGCSATCAPEVSWVWK